MDSNKEKPCLLNNALEGRITPSAMFCNVCWAALPISFFSSAHRLMTPGWSLIHGCKMAFIELEHLAMVLHCKTSTLAGVSTLHSLFIDINKRVALQAYPCVSKRAFEHIASFFLFYTGLYSFEYAGWLLLSNENWLYSQLNEASSVLTGIGEHYSWSGWGKREDLPKSRWKPDFVPCYSGEVLSHFELWRMCGNIKPDCAGIFDKLPSTSYHYKHSQRPWGRFFSKPVSCCLCCECWFYW